MKYSLLSAAIALATSSWATAAEKPTESSELRGNLTLDNAVLTALQRNPDVLRAKMEIERTRGLIVEIRAQALPHVALSGNYKQQDPKLLEANGGSSNFSQPSNDKNWLITLEARQLLYSGGQVRAANKIAKLTEEQSNHQFRDTLEKIIAQTRSQFYAILLNRKLITVAEESIRLLGDELRDQKNRLAAGTVPRFNVLRAEVALANAKPDLIRAKNNYLIAQLELAKTLGQNAPHTVDGKPSFEVVGELRQEPCPWSLEDALSMARDRRSSLKVQKQNVLTEEQQITVAKAGYRPRFEASAGLEARNARLSSNLSDETHGWYFGVDGSWNIFDGLETKGRVDQAKARLTSAKIALDDAAQQVELEVQKAFAKIGEARELIASQVKVVEQADEALRLARERLAAGAGTQLDVLDAQVALTKARTTQQQALYDYEVALAEFDRSTGAETVYENHLGDSDLPRVAPRKAKPIIGAGN